MVLGDRRIGYVETLRALETEGQRARYEMALVAKRSNLGSRPTSSTWYLTAVVLPIFLLVEADMLCCDADLAAGMSSSSSTIFNTCRTIHMQKLTSRWSPRVDDCGSPSAGNLRPSWECTMAVADGDQSRCTLLPNGILRSSQTGQHTPTHIWTSPLPRMTSWLPVKDL